MRNMKDVLSRAVQRLSRLAAMMLLGAGVVTSAIAQAPPSNDDAGNAQLLTGASGAIWGTNFNATVQAGEPNHLPGAGFTDHASVWYTWTPDAGGATVFDIPVSSNFVTRTTLDTVMAVYAITTNSLITVANNDDSGPSTFNSRCGFTAVGGTTYYIVIDSWEDGGAFELQWNCATNTGGSVIAAAPRNAGTFQFTRSPYLFTGTGVSKTVVNYASAFVAGQNDSVTLGDALSRSTKESVPGGRVTVTRVGGSTGRVLVDYVVTNDWYQVEMHTNVIVVGDGNGNYSGSVVVAKNYPIQAYSGGYIYGSFGNYVTTNEWVVITYTNLAQGTDPVQLASDLWARLPRLNLTGSTNKTAYLSGRMDFTGWTQGKMIPVVTTNFSTLPPYTITLTTNIVDSSIELVPTASPFGVYTGNSLGYYDYVPDSGTLVFDDFQMSKDIVVELGTLSLGGTFYYGSSSYVVGENDMGGSYHPGRDSVVKIVLSNPRFDPLESTDTNSATVVTDIKPPEISPYGQSVDLVIEDSSINAGYGVPQGPESAPPFGMGTDAANPWPIFNFERATYRCTSDVGEAVIRVQRTGNVKGASVLYSIDWTKPLGIGSLDTFPLEAGSEYAVPTYDYTNTEGTLSWGDNDSDWKAINIPIINDSSVEFDRDLLIQLRVVNPNDPQSYIGNIGTATLTILFKKEWNGPQVAGAVDRTYNTDFRTNSPFNYPDGGLEFPAMNANPGANKPVYSLAVQPDGKTVIGGAFTALNGSPIKRIARMATNGWPDLTFDPGDGANDTVNVVALDASGKVVIGGQFTSMNGTSAAHVARLTANGALDGSFNAGSGADAAVRAIAIQPDGKILVGGDFTIFNGTNRSHIARLNANGTLDKSFDPGDGPDNTVFAIAVDPNGGVLIGGAFTVVGNVAISSLARLNTNGSLDQSFNVGAGGINGPVYALALQPDGSILTGGAFSLINLSPRANIARLKSNGQLDASFDPGIGTDGAVYTIAVQNDGAILIGGIFTQYNYTRRVGIARLLSDGPLDTTFMDSAYNQFAGVPTHYANPGALNLNDVPAAANTRNYVMSIGLDATNNVLIGGSFAQVGGGMTRDDIRNRANVARLVGGATPGPGNVGFMQSVYSVDENAGYLFVSLTRTNGYLGSVGVTFMTNLFPAGVGAAKPTDFSLSPAYTNPVWYTWYDYATTVYKATNSTLPRTWYGWRVGDGYFGPNYNTLPQASSNAWVYLGINDNTIVDGNRTAQLALGAPQSADQFFLGGENIPLAPALGRSTAILQIVDNDFHAGTFAFSATNYTVVENAGTVTLTIVRTNGSTGVATVDYTTVNGSATNKVDFTGITGTLSFGDGVTSQTITVTIKDNSIVQPDRSFKVVLSKPTGLASVDPVLGTTAVTIVDNDFLEGHITFAAAGFSVSELSTNAMVRISREGGSSKSLTVQCAATNGTAINGVNFVAITNTLSWDAGDISDRYLLVPIIRDNAVTADLSVSLRLWGAVIAGNPSDINTSGVLGGYGQITNAVLTIVNQDFYGNLAFSSPNYNVMENGGRATVTVTRMNGSVGTISVGYRTFNGTAVAGVNYLGTTNRLIFGPGEMSKTLTVTLVDDFSINPDRTFGVTLYNANPTNVLSSSGVVLTTNATVRIVDNESNHQPAGSVDPTFQVGTGFDGVVFAVEQQPDGKILVGGGFDNLGQVPRHRIARLAADGSVDLGFQFFMAGADGNVRSIVSQTPDAGFINGPTVIGGEFNKVNNVNRHGIARLKEDGTLDETFDPGSGVDNTIFAMKEVFSQFDLTFQRKILIAGAFAHYNQVVRNGIARLNDDGTLDTTFDPGAGVGGANGTIFALAIQGDSSILIGGDFVQFGGTAHSHLARLGANGTTDSSFNPVIDDSVRTIVVQPDGKILIGGFFKNVNGTACNHIARLNADGSLDRTFQVGQGTDDAVLTIAIDGTGKIMVGGEFLRASGVTRHGLTRLNPDGTVDPGINFGNGADKSVDAVIFQNDGNMVVGGGFTTFNYVPSPGLVRLFGGDMVGSGTLEFDQPIYNVYENGTNVTVNVRRLGATFPTANGDLTVGVVTADGPALPDLRAAFSVVDYLSVATNVVFTTGETFQSIQISIVDNFVLDGDRAFNVALTNYSDSTAVGGQTSAKVKIVDDEVGLSFAVSSDRVMENVTSKMAEIKIARTGNTNADVSIDVISYTNGTARVGVRYLAITNTVRLLPGETNGRAFLPIIDDPFVIGDQTVQLGLTNAVGAIVLEPRFETLTIVEDDTAPGSLMFGTNVYRVSEGAGTAFIEVRRTNGLTGVVTVDFSTTNGTALAGDKYYPTNGTLTFADGELVKFISVGIIDEPLVEGDRNFQVMLSNPQGGSAIRGTNTANVVIVDNDSGFGFTKADYTADELGGSVVLSIVRLGDSNGVLTVDYFTSDGTAHANTNYVAVNDQLRFASGEVLKTISIPILHDQAVTDVQSFLVSLTNPVGRVGLQLTRPAVATVNIVDGDSGFRFSTNSYTVSEGKTNGIGTNAMITVVRDGSRAISNSVSYQASGSSDGKRFVSVSGYLPFDKGISSNSFLVPVLYHSDFQGDTNVDLLLYNPTGGTQLIYPSEATLTILDNHVNLGFSSSIYSVSEGSAATITVVRTGLTNDQLSVDFATANGTAISNKNYVATSGTLTFLPGQTTNQFVVQTTTDHDVGGDLSLLIALSSVTGGAGLANPSTATLIIKESEGTAVSPAGMALISEPAATRNGVIDSNETVTVEFGLRCLSGATGNLMAMLQQTGGITNVVTTSQVYGPMKEGGHVVSMPFTFTAAGNNGQSITATLLLTNELGTHFKPAIFTFILGQVAHSYTNVVPIQIRDNTNALPYPSAIVVDGTLGSVGQVRVTLLGVTHTYPDDINILLSGPSGLNTLLMSHCGGPKPINNLTLGFDDNATTSLSDGGQLVSSTNKPTAFTPIYSFLGSAPSRPFGTSLSVFNNTSANGPWSLWVEDDKTQDTGAISNGWILTLTSGTPISPTADLEVTMTSPPVGVIGNQITNSITITNYGPGDITGVSLTNVIPSGFTFVSASAPYTVNGGALIFPIGSLPLGQGTSFEVVSVPNLSGTMTNVVTVGGVTEDKNLDNNTAVSVTTVADISADLSISLSDAPNPIGFGDLVTYTITVVNNGPSVATDVKLTNYFPLGIMLPVAPANLPGSYLTNGGQAVIVPLSNLPVNGQVVVQLHARMIIPGVLTDTAMVGTPIESLKANNHASVKTLVGDAPSVTVTTGANGLTLTWPQSDAFSVQVTGSLTDPIQWQDVTTPAPTATDGQMVLPLTLSKTNQFFRLKVKAP